jgi:hypothetical protein
MICHVCEAQAIGQCKKCNKFYCKLHGDVTCEVCDAAIQEKRTRTWAENDAWLPESGAPRASAPIYAGPRCYKCTEPASAACAKCGQFYCPAHRGGTSFFDNTNRSWFQEGRVLCQDCLKSVDSMGVIGCVIAFVVLGIMGIVALFVTHAH